MTLVIYWVEPNVEYMFFFLEVTIILIVIIGNLLLLERMDWVSIREIKKDVLSAADEKKV